MIFNLDIKNTLILIIAVINITYGAIIYLKDKKNATSVWFFFLAISVGLWGVSMFLFRSVQEEYLAGIFARILYFSAAIIPIVFIYFSAVFPNASSSFGFRQKYILPIPFLMITLLSLVPDYLIKGTQILVGEETHILFKKIYHTLYVFYINIFFAYGYFLLVKKYLSSRVQDVVLSKQITYIIAGTSISTMIGVFTNLFGPYVGIFKFNWVGQIGNVVMISAISYAIVKHQLFSLKLILVELAVLLLNMFLLFNVFTSSNGSMLILNIFVSAFIFIFSIFLLRGIYKDIRDREKIEALAKEMATTNEKLHILEQQKTEFVSIASHQLRTPLTVIKGYASMILEGTFGVLSEPVRDAMDRLYKSSERIVALVEDLLTVSRLEQGRMMLHFETVNFVSVVKGVLSEMDEDIKKSNLDLSFTAEEGEDFPVSIDEKKFKQVVRHVLDNAIEYTYAPGRVRVVLAFDYVINKIRLTVSDTGVGMTAEQIQSIFERFNLKIKTQEEQGEEEEVESGKLKVESGIQGSNPEEEGTETPSQRTPGIGLYIAQEILEAHHGTLYIQSAGPNEGTTVIVELPRGE